MIEPNIKKLLQVFVIILFVTGLFTVIHEYAVNVDVSETSYFFAPYWNYIVKFFQLGTVTFLAALAYNIYGYLRNFFKGHYTEEYDLAKYLETLAFFGAFVTTIGTLIPPPYDAIGMMLVVIGKFILSEIRHFQKGT